MTYMNILLKGKTWGYIKQILGRSQRNGGCERFHGGCRIYRLWGGNYTKEEYMKTSAGSSFR